MHYIFPATAACCREQAQKAARSDARCLAAEALQSANGTIRIDVWDKHAERISQCGRTIWIADAHRDDGKRFIVHADEKLTAFVELERAIHENCIYIVCRPLAGLRPR